MSTRTAVFTCALAALCLLGLTTAPDASAGSPGGSVSWLGDIDAALATAADDDRVVMVDVYATWCGPCHMLDRQTFPDEKVVELSKKLVPVKIDGESARGEQLMERYHVVAFPTVLFIGPDGHEIDRIVGFVPPEDFTDIASGYLEGRGTLEDLEKQLAETPDDLDLREDVFQRHVMRGNETQALEHADKLRALLADYTPASDDQPDRATRTAMIDYHLARYLYLRGKADHQRAHDLLVGIQTTYPDLGLAASANYPLARALIGLGKEDAAFEALQRFIDADPKSSGGYNTVAWFTFREKVRMDFGIEVARKGLELDPDNAALYDTLAELLAATGDHDGALAAIDTAIELDPDEPYYKEQRERFAKPLVLASELFGPLEPGDAMAEVDSPSIGRGNEHRIFGACENSPKKQGFVAPVEEAIADRVDEVRQCYEQQRAVDSTLAGRIEVMFTLRRDGSVRDADIRSSSFHDDAGQAVEACALEVMRELVVESDDDSLGCVVVHPFGFAPAP